MTNTNAWTLVMTTNHGKVSVCMFECACEPACELVILTNALIRKCESVRLVQGWRAEAGQYRGGRPWSRWRLMSGDSVSSSCCRDAEGRGCELAGAQTGKEIKTACSKPISSVFIKACSQMSDDILMSTPVPPALNKTLEDEFFSFFLMECIFASSNV